MTSALIAQRRLHSQRLVGPPFASAAETVRWLGAVQSQDYAGAKWALAQRTAGLTDAELDAQFDQGVFLRTHVLRPTWHFVMPEDIRWMLELTAPRVHAATAYYHRRLELDETVFRRSSEVLARALREGPMTRPELGKALEHAGISIEANRASFLVMRAELDAVICSGGRRGKQFTYALLDERAPGARKLHRDEALGELALRYFRSHGPAQVEDFAWWSGLTLASARSAIELCGSLLQREETGGKSYWSGPSALTTTPASAHLLPNYDEYVIAYSDRTALFNRPLSLSGDALHEALGAHFAAVNGDLVGGWRRKLDRGRVTITLEIVAPIEPGERAALEAQARRYGEFLGLPVELVEAPPRRLLPGSKPRSHLRSFPD